LLTLKAIEVIFPAPPPLAVNSAGLTIYCSRAFIYHPPYTAGYEEYELEVVPVPMMTSTPNIPAINNRNVKKIIVFFITKTPCFRCFFS